MNAYGTALDNTGTTMVLSPNSEFFRFFRDPDGKEGGAKPLGPQPAPAAPVSGAAPATAPAAPAVQPATGQ